VLDKLSKAMAKVFNDPEVIAKIEKAGLNPDYLDSVLAQKRLVEEFNTVTEIVQKGRIGKLKPEEMKERTPPTGQGFKNLKPRTKTEIPKQGRDDKPGKSFTVMLLC
jgi:hypothetical protein